MDDQKPDCPKKKISIGAILSLKNGSKVLILGKEILKRGCKLIRIRSLQDNKEKFIPISSIEEKPE